MPAERPSPAPAERTRLWKAASRSGPVVRLLVSALVWCSLGLTAGLAVLVVAPPLVGHDSLTVLSGSMEPTLGVGSVVLDERISPLEARVGDVVTFPSPENRARLITHRLQRVRVRARTAYMVTKGDANDTVERWSVPVAGRLGRVAYQVPKIGYARQWVSGWGSREAIMALVAALGFWMLIDIWRPRGNDLSDSMKPDSAARRRSGTPRRHSWLRVGDRRAPPC
ncbi:MAG: signal peptidase I, partial [Chloroflexota bacterium]|nr:signal peptidase I [Chloroflexota bacterium]